MGYHPHEVVEVLVTGRPEVEVPHSHLDHPGVGLRTALLVCFDGKLAGKVLPQETQNIKLFTGDRSQFPVGRCHESQRESQNHKGSCDHPMGGEECWVIASKIAEF